MTVYLRQKPSGDLYVFNEHMAKRNDMTQLTAKEAAPYLAAAARKRNKTVDAPAPEVKAAPKKAAPKKVPKKAKVSAEEAEAMAQQELELDTQDK